MITTNSKEMAERLKLLRNYGQKQRYDSVTEGINSRLDELQAAVLSVKLKHLDDWNERRRELASLYSSLITSPQITLPETAGEDREHAFHLFVVRHPKRDALKDYLAEKGVATLIHYPIPIHLQGGYKWLGLKVGSLPNTEKAAREILSLPLYPELEDGDVERIAGLINAFTD